MRVLTVANGGVDDGDRTHDHRNHNPALSQLSYVHHRLIPTAVLCGLPLETSGLFGAPGRTRTCDPRLRRPLLYPTELRAPIWVHLKMTVRYQRVAPVRFVRVLNAPLFFESTAVRIGAYWSGSRDSNPRHPAPKAGALPDCAIPRVWRRLQISRAAIIRTGPVPVNPDRNRAVCAVALSRTRVPPA